MADKPIDKKEIEELRRLMKLLGEEIKAVDFDNLIKSGAGAKTLLNSLRKDAEEFTSDISYAAEGFRKVVEEIKNTNEGIKLANKSFNKLSDIADKIKYHQQDISKLTLKEVQTLQKQAQQQKTRLDTANGLLKSKISELNLTLIEQDTELDFLIRKKNLSDEQIERLRELEKLQTKSIKDLSKTEAAQRNIQGILKDQDALFGGLTVTLDKINRELEEEKKKLGLTGAILEGLNKIPFLNGIIDTNAALDAAKEKIKDGGNRFQAMSAAVSTVGKQIKTHLSDPLFIVGFLVTELISTFKSVDSAIGDLAKGFDMSYNSAANLRMELTDIANFSMDAAVTTKGLQESMMAIGQTLGVNAQLNKEDLVTFTKLREQAGYTNDELVGIQKLTLAQGGSLEDNAKSFLGTVEVMNAQNKLSINAKQLLKEVANVSDSIKLSVGGTTEKLAEAAFKAKQFGINLQQADGIASSLLDFESSIANELSAELITGKDLNLEKARLLAINGDIAGASAEILKQVGGTAEFTKMNRIQQEALAKSVGLSRDDLAKSLVDREASAKLGAKEGQSAQDRYNELVKSYGVEKASAMLGDEALANQFQQQSVQERLAQSVEKLKEIFVAIAEPILAIISPIVDTLMPVIGVIAGTLGTVIGWLGKGLKFIIDWGKYLLPIYGVYKGIQIAQKSIVGWEIASNAQKQIAANRGLAQIGANRTILALEKESLVAKIAGNLQLAFMLIREQGLNGLKTYALTLDDKSIAKKIIIKTYDTGSLIIARLKSLFSKQDLATEQAGAATRKGSLLTNIGTAAMKAIQSLSSIPVIGWALGLAAAAGTVALGYKFMKGDDVVSPGYGKRTLMSPEGAITLNDKDTVIAGTNLGGKGTDLYGRNKPQPQQAPPPPAAPIIVQVTPNVNVGKERISNAFEQNSYSIS